MKSIQSIAVATWMLEHLTFGSDHEALSGDLLEEFQRGRSTAWYWRQALSAIGVGLLRKSATYALPLLFATAWSTLYPAWRAIGRVQLTMGITRLAVLHLIDHRQRNRPRSDLHLARVLHLSDVTKRNGPRDDRASPSWESVDCPQRASRYNNRARLLGSRRTLRAPRKLLCQSSSRRH